jgi:site-specific DNA recombinase
VKTVRKVTRIDGNNALQAFKPKVRVAAYCRVSTDSDEQMASLEAQKDHYESYIKANPDWEFAGIYYDEGISGTKKENRTGLLRLLADCENKKIDFIITKSVSRFARNTTDCIEMVRKLTDLGVFIYFEKENINTQRMEGELVLTILSSLAENESLSIAIYKSVERILNFLTKNILNTIPIAANIQTVEKSIHPVLPCNVISVKGVYVPAIKIYIAE